MFRNIEDEGESVEHTFPLRLAIPMVLLYLLLCAFVVHMFDYQLRGEDEKGLQVSLSVNNDIRKLSTFAPASISRTGNFWNGF